MPEENDYVKVTRILGVKRGTVYSIVARNQANGGVPPRPRGGARNVRLDAEMQLKIVDIVERHPEFTLAQVNYQLQTDLPLKPRISNLCDQLSDEKNENRFARPQQTRRN